MAGRRTFFFEGLGVSEGVAIGPAYVIESDRADSETWEIAEGEVEAEIERFEEALRLAKDDVRSLGQQVAERVDRQQAAIFDAHLLMLEDPFIVEATIKRIRTQRRNAESIFWEIVRELGERMQAIDDQYFSERNHDLYDVARRVIRFLRRLDSPDRVEPPRNRSIVVAHNLGPAETAQFSRDHVVGFCMNEGGATGHAAILSKALGIPAVVGLEFITNYVRTGDMLILDGSEGKVVLHPTPEQIRHYEKKKERLAAYRRSLEEFRTVPAITRDGAGVTVLANIELPEEIASVRASGAEGIGLVRTEFLYLSQPALPSLDLQTAAYRAILAGVEGLPVVIRTLDIGGDKLPAFPLAHKETNPFMGRRAIRLCLDKPEMFRTQLRAMIAAAAGREISILVPMVSGLDEVRQTRALLSELIAERGTAGQPVPTAVRLGAMVEIPSAALLAPALCREVDFLSIGTNDLVQYTLAVDRTNSDVASLYRESHPAVLHLIQHTVTAGIAAGKPVSVCGEMSSDPRYAILLVGMGVRTLSMAPSAIPVVKRAIRAVTLTEAQELAREVLLHTTPEEVERTLHQRLHRTLEDLKQAPPSPSQPGASPVAAG
jgi:phosphotransferase system enzyme I (PtsI)